MRRRGGKGKALRSSWAPEDNNFKPNVRRQRLGVWDLVTLQQSIRDRLPTLPVLHWSAPTSPLKRFLGDIFFLSPVWLVLWLIANALNSLVPAASTYCSSQLLTVIQRAVEHGSVDEHELFRVAFTRLLCTFFGRLLPYLINNVCGTRLDTAIQSFFEEHLMYAHLRLDNVTFNDPKVQQELERVSPTSYNSAWRAVSECIRIISLTAQLVTQVSVLGSILHQHNEGVLYLALTMAAPALQWMSRSRSGYFWSFYANCTNEDYLRLLGYRELACTPSSFREEIVMNNLQAYILQNYREMKTRLGATALNLNEAIRALSRDSVLQLVVHITGDMCKDLPQVLFALTALRTPSISLSLTWLALLRETVDSISQRITTLTSVTQDMEEHFECIRILYSCAEIQNQLADGNAEYPLVGSDPSGMAVEFRDVKFRYPSSSKLALNGVSFKIEPGQLCVIVGRNGGGKSSVVKLISRLYDCTEGAILVDDRPIQDLRLSDYRDCLSTLPQDFTFFPLTVAENIGVGDSENAQDAGRIRKAAELGGALQFIEKDLANGFKTRLKGPETFHIRAADDRFARWAHNEIQKHRTVSLSGGQWQRLALSRTFMRSSEITRLLCYDERKWPTARSQSHLTYPTASAALDPLAEYDLFQRLRELRGKKTMVFVTHRFGHLTRQADKIIVLDDGQVLEQGTHAELLANDGQYANMYKLQAMAFSAM